MTIRDIAVAFGYEVDQASVNRAEGTIKGLSNMAKKLLGGIAVYFSVKGVSSLAQAAADAEALESQFSQVFGNMEEAATESLQRVADEAGAMTNRMKSSFTQIAAFTKTTGANEAEALALAERGMRLAADSAAFYDRSLEDVTASLRSFLKGNFEQDAALGISATETTRNAAAMELYGKSFKDLSEYQKQLTLLKMVEDGNKLSGAMGQAAREADTWTNQLGNMKQAFQDLKAAGGSGFLKPAILVLKAITTLVQKVTVRLKELTSENGKLTKAMERGHALIKRIQPTVERLVQSCARGMTKIKDALSTVIHKLGGFENVLKLAGMALGALGVLKVVVQLKKMITAVKALEKAMIVGKLKVLGIVAALVFLGLVIDDFINFMKGNKSVIGTLFDGAGIGAENARRAIANAFNKVKKFLENTWGQIKASISKHGASIKDSVSKVFGGVVSVVKSALEVLLSVCSTVFKGLSMIFKDIDLSTPIEAIVSTIDVLLGILGTLGDFISKHTGLVKALIVVYGGFKLVSATKQLVSFTKQLAITTAAKIKDKAETLYLKALYAKDFVVSLAKSTAAMVKQAAQFVATTAVKVADTVAQGAMTAATLAWNVAATIATGVTTAFGAAIAFLTSPIGIVVAAIAALIAIGVLLVKNWEKVKEFAKKIWESIVGVFSAAWEGIKNVFAPVASFFKGVWNSIVNIFTKIGTVVSDAITGAVKAAINGVLSGAATIINGFISAINLAISAINLIPGVEIKKLKKLEVPQLAEGGIATRATGAIIGEGAEPEAVMPLSKLGAMISGYIKDAKESGALNAMKSFMGASTANPMTALNSASGKGYNVVQNNEFNNSYYGSDREAAKNVSNGMKKSATDATTQMARALAYGRG